MRKPRSSATTRGSTVGTRSTAAAAASSSPLVVKRLMASRFFMVGKMRSNSPALARARASSGRTHTVSTVSWSSWMGTWPGGTAATKKRVS